ncbi:replication initiation protein [Pasteurellaceae bacterium LFhippo2]|nr:replication initiation protein [Pasteurellaceae bacterium LFhippo2]
MSELIIYKANELVVSRYDLTEQETRLISYAVAKLNPMTNGSEEDRTVIIPYREYATAMKIDDSLAWHNLNNAVSELMQRTIEVVNPDPMAKIGKIIFQWVNQAKFDQQAQAVELTFSKEIRPFLFKMKEFIKYKLEHIRSMNNKYSMRFYEVLLKELGESKCTKKDVVFNIDNFKDLLMLEANYPTYKQFNQRILKVVIDDVNKNSNLKVSMKTQGRPVNTLIFSIEKTTKNQQLDLVKEIEHAEQAEIEQKTVKRKTAKQQVEQRRYKGLKIIMEQHQKGEIDLNDYEKKFVPRMIEIYENYNNFEKASDPQIQKADVTLAKYLPRF